MTRFKYYPLAETTLARGVVVVIDVLRAFTTAAYAFTNGAKQIFPVSSVKEALLLKSCLGDALLMGEVDGVKPEKFDFSNSPVEIMRAKINGRTLIQRTSAGTQGVVQVHNAELCFAASFVVARATADHLREINPDLISFIITGESQGRDGDEDRACGEYIEALYKGCHPVAEEYLARIKKSTVGRSFFRGKLKYLLAEDLNLCTQSDVMDFYIRIYRENDLLVMRKEIN